jgi:hypothetical protein
MSVKKIDVNDIPGYKDRQRPASQMTEETMAILGLREYESISLPCTKEHHDTGEAKDVCRHKQTIYASLKQLMNRRAKKIHGMRWPNTPFWIRCYDKTIYIFRKPWGVHLGNTVHPRYYIMQRDNPDQFENLWGVLGKKSKR